MDENSGLNKKRTVVTCLFCSKSFIFRNVQQLALHLACPSEGIGKSSGCPTVKSIAPAVQVKYAAEVAAKEAETTKKKSTEKQRMAIEAAERDEERKKRKVSEGGSGTQRSISSSLASSQVDAPCLNSLLRIASTFSFLPTFGPLLIVLFLEFFIPTQVHASRFSTSCLPPSRPQARREGEKNLCQPRY